MTPRLAVVWAKCSWIKAELCNRLAWVSITPLGAAVEPEVYWSSARVEGVRAGRHHAPASSSVSASVGSQPSAEKAGSWDAKAWARPLISAVVSTTAGCALLTIARRRGRVRWRRAGSGGYAGTATMAAYRQPKNAAMYSRPGG